MPPSNLKHLSFFCTRSKHYLCMSFYLPCFFFNLGLLALLNLLILPIKTRKLSISTIHFHFSVFEGKARESRGRGVTIGHLYPTIKEKKNLCTSKDMRKQGSIVPEHFITGSSRQQELDHLDIPALASPKLFSLTSLIPDLFHLTGIVHQIGFQMAEQSFGPSM